QGTMLTLHTTPDHITPLLEGTALEIAARNSPTNTVVSGTVSDIEPSPPARQRQGSGPVR
ncbi:hypothetical protein, partial [Streptomyces sp. IB2014 016-6]|uniref:hypothetical protein n=1 Tax=Streptomyces sp. IB2014 016-6 TaxID=2517818 RepID=UPI0019D63081